jgi:hypothetical protein
MLNVRMIQLRKAKAAIAEVSLQIGPSGSSISMPSPTSTDPQPPNTTWNALEASAASAPVESHRTQRIAVHNADEFWVISRGIQTH